MNWNDVISVYDVDYILGNPPFVGKQHQNTEQKNDMELLFKGVKSAGVLDYVSAWYMKAVHYLRGNERMAGLLDNLLDVPKPPRERVKVAFVSTNSITQGEQVGVLWAELLRQDTKIHFAHRTFRWSNEARGMAAVHCVIIGFALHDTKHKIIYDYSDSDGEFHALLANNINPYLVDAPDVVLTSRRSPICLVPEIVFGSMPNDGGNLLLSEEEKQELLRHEPPAHKWLRPFMGATEYINRINRWCLWLVDISPQELRSLPEISKRVERVKLHRYESDRETTRELAEYPTLFGEIRQPKTEYILIPCHSSEGRDYIPLGFMSPTIICGNANLCIPSPSLFVFGGMSSKMHMAWVKYVCGRIKSDYRYTGQIVYNNFPWPADPTDKQRDAIEHAAQSVLDARSTHPDSSLADLYDPVAMPPDLRKAHQALDKAVDAAYGKKSFGSDAERVSFLFELYHKYTSLLPSQEKPKQRRQKTRRLP